MVEWEEKVGETPGIKRNGYNSHTPGQQNQYIYIEVRNLSNFSGLTVI